MKLALVGAAFMASFAFAWPAAAQFAPLQIDATRDAAIRDCTELTRKQAGKRSDDQNQRTATFKDCMIKRGQRP